MQGAVVGGGRTPPSTSRAPGASEYTSPRTRARVMAPPDRWTRSPRYSMPSRSTTRTPQPAPGSGTGPPRTSPPPSPTCPRTRATRPARPSPPVPSNCPTTPDLPASSVRPRPRAWPTPLLHRGARPRRRDHRYSAEATPAFLGFNMAGHPRPRGPDRHRRASHLTRIVCPGWTSVSPVALGCSCSEPSSRARLHFLAMSGSQVAVRDDQDALKFLRGEDRRGEPPRALAIREVSNSPGSQGGVWAARPRQLTLGYGAAVERAARPR